MWKLQGAGDQEEKTFAGVNMSPFEKNSIHLSGFEFSLKIMSTVLA